jgi:hypothetical protein
MASHSAAASLPSRLPNHIVHWVGTGHRHNWSFFLWDRLVPLVAVAARLGRSVKRHGAPRASLPRMGHPRHGDVARR